MGDRMTGESAAALNAPPVLPDGDVDACSIDAFLQAADAYARSFKAGAVCPERSDIDLLLESLRRVRDPSVLLADVYQNLAGACYESGAAFIGIEAAQNAVRIADACGSVTHRIRSRNALSLVLQNAGDLAGAMRQARRAIDLAREGGAVWALIPLQINLALNLTDIGDWDEAGRLAEEALRLSESVNHMTERGPTMLSQAYVVKALIAEQRQDYCGAIEQFECAIRSLVDAEGVALNWSMALSFTYCRAACVAACAGELQRARRHIAEGRRLARPGSAQLLMARLAETLVLAAEGHEAVALARLEGLLAECRTERNYLVDVLTYMAWLQRKLGNESAAQRHEWELRNLWRLAQVDR